MTFDVQAALKRWQEKHPEKSERVAILRGELRECESERRVAPGHAAKGVYRGTAKNLRLMLAAEGVKP